uniref:SET domain-containing protein n=1 Tax=Alexandrium monilatum TaxID=311494 RepID=A0A7S4QJ95_9DINO
MPAAGEPPAAEGPASAGVAHINAHGEQHHQGVLRCRWTEQKGRILHAARDFAEGEVILVESPLHIVQEDEASPAFKHLQQLCADREDDFDYDPLWYWCALKSLTKEELQGARLGGWAGADAAVQHNLLLLHHEEVSEPSSSSEVLVKELAPGASPMLVERLTQIWVLNCFEYSDAPQGYSTYFFSSFMSHSCWPNAVWHYAGADHVLRARRAVRAGDEVCISYLPEHGLMQSAPVRRLELHDTKRFWCACERCSGPRDLGRGLWCPLCGEGAVFARSPDPGPARDDQLLAAHLAGAACEGCGRSLGKREAARLAGHEKRLKGIVDDYAERTQAGSAASIAVKELQATEAFIDSAFAQHALADLAWEQLADCYAAHQRCADQRRLLERRCSFHAAAYPGLNGSHAWSLEARGDAMMRAGGRAPRPGGARQAGGRRERVWQVAAREEPEQALQLYAEAQRILTLMFGEGHEYVTHVERKRRRAERAAAAIADQQKAGAQHSEGKEDAEAEEA